MARSRAAQVTGCVYYALVGLWGAALGVAGYGIDTREFWIGLSVVVVAHLLGRLAEALDDD